MDFDLLFDGYRGALTVPEREGQGEVVFGNQDRGVAAAPTERAARSGARQCVHLHQTNGRQPAIKHVREPQNEPILRHQPHPDPKAEKALTQEEDSIG